MLIEYKIKTERRPWEDLPVHDIISHGDRLEVFENLRETIENLVEIRWSYKGDLQGHYVVGNGGQIK